MKLIQKLLSKAKPYFQEFRKLSAQCPKCGSQMILKFASNPQRHGGRKLSIILCCSNGCDRDIWNTDANEKEFTHWWLDGNRNKEGYEKILKSLPEKERVLVKNLEYEVRMLNLYEND